MPRQSTVPVAGLVIQEKAWTEEAADDGLLYTVLCARLLVTLWVMWMDDFANAVVLEVQERSTISGVRLRRMRRQELGPVT